MLVHALAIEQQIIKIPATGTRVLTDIENDSPKSNFGAVFLFEVLSGAQKNATTITSEIGGTVFNGMWAEPRTSVAKELNKQPLKRKDMKTIILTLGLIAIGCVCRAQTPAGVLNSFAAMYPDARVKTWTKEGVDLWMVTFKDKDDKTKDMAYFKKNGTWVKTETKLPAMRDLPNTVERSWKRTNYSDWMVADIKQVKYPSGDLYVMKVEDGCETNLYATPVCSETYNLYFTRSGELLKQTLAKNDNFDDASGADFR